MARSHRLISFLGLCLVTALLHACTRQPSSSEPPATWMSWRAKRLDSIVGSNGWVTLVGLHWLVQGTNSFGRFPANQVVIRSANFPERAGLFVRRDESVHFLSTGGVHAKLDGKPVEEAELVSDLDTKPSRLEISGLIFTVIDRDGRIGIRVKDPNAQNRTNFAGLRYFPYDQHWKITGRFERAATTRLLRIRDVSGGVQRLKCPGQIKFEVGGKLFHLDLIEEKDNDDYEIFFHDKTSGISTYGAGRFLDIPKADREGNLVIDFNYSYNPPCAFTPYATCPLPPSQNFMDIAVPAGELDGHAH